MKKKREALKSNMADVVSGAYGELNSLGEELREWADNIQEKFSQTDKYSRIDESASTLENLNEPTVPESLEKLEVSVMPLSQKRRGHSRPSRRDQAVYELDVAIQVLQEHIDSDDKLLKQDTKDDAETLINDLEELKSEAENVEFPGMYG